MENLKHIKRLSQIKTNAGVKFLTPAAFPGNHCPMHTALALSANVKGMSTLVIGTAECGTYSRNVISKAKTDPDTLHFMYILDANEVVFGCRKGLIEAVKEMDNSGAKAIMLILTCVPEVIGEDIEGIVHEIQPKVKAKLSFVKMGHFRCNSHPSGYWKTLLAFGELMKPQGTQRNIINILGRSPEEDHIPMPEILSLMAEKGFELRMLAPKSDIKDFETAPDARLNIVISPFMNPLAQMMEESFSVPSISLHEYYSVSEIDRIYGELSEILLTDCKSPFGAIRSAALSLETTVRNQFAGKKFIATHRNSMMPLPLSLYMAELGLAPLLLHMEEFYPDDKKWAKILIEKGYDPFICHMVNEISDASVLENIGADFSFGEIPEGTDSLPSLKYMYELYGQSGYERTLKLLSRMMKEIDLTERRASRGAS